MIKFKYRYCKVHMAQYLSGDLSDTTRRRIARYIDECQDCYNEYIRQRNLANELERELPSLGRPSTQKLDTMWASIQAEMAQPDTQSNMLYRPRRHPTWSYGLVMVVVALLLLTPLVVGHHVSSSPVQLPPRPQAFVIVKTPTVVAQENHVVLASITQPSIPIQFPLLQNTPAPGFHQ